MLDVSAGAEYYGPEGPYQLMAGKDASYAFAMMSLKAEDAHANLAGTRGMVRRLAWQRPTDRERERERVREAAQPKPRARAPAPP